MDLRLEPLRVAERAVPDGDMVGAIVLIGDRRAAFGAKPAFRRCARRLPGGLLAGVAELFEHNEGSGAENIADAFFAHIAVAIADLMGRLVRLVPHRTA